jgi:DNA polymerase bacteriophage-type
MIHIDFESRSKVDINEVGAWAYSAHPSTEVLCMAFAIDDGEITCLPKTFFDNYRGEMTALEILIRRGETFAAFNAFFEQCMWQNQLVKKLDFPRIPIKQWRCMMAKSLAYAHPQSLGNAAQALDSSHQKSMAGKSIMLKMCKPNGKGQWYEDPEDFEKLYQYCIDDVAAEREIDHLLPDLIPQEQNHWFLDQLINQRGISIDILAVQKALSFIEQYSTALNNIVYAESGMQLDRVTRRQAVLDWCQSQGVEVPGYTKADVTKVLEQEGLPQEVRIVLETKLELGKTSVAKYQALNNSVTDGRIRDTLIYHGATTGRWTGKLFQLQNLPKGNVRDTEAAIRLLKEESLENFEIFYPDVMGALSSCIRGMIIASPGCELYVGDYNAIEARVLFWLHGEAYGLKQYHEGTDIYVDMAKRIYNDHTVSKSQRELGKRAVLGCGYGMGHVKFAATCANQGQVISDELAKRAVDAYRNTYTSVVAGWYAQESAAINTLTTKQDTVCGRIRWKMDARGTLLCQLPSNRCLSYPRAFLEYTDTPWGERKLTIQYYSVDSKTKRWMVERTYGGKITENITQAIARDLLAAAMFRVEQRGYPVIFSVHDEIVCDVPQGKNLDSIEDWGKLLTELPKWASGCPIKAECWKGKRYKK